MSVEKSQAEKDRILEQVLALDPDKEVNDKFSFTEDYSRQVLGALSQNQALLSTHSKLCKPEYFSRDDHRLIAGIIFKHFNTYGKSPSQEYVKQEIKDTLAEKDEALRNLHLGEVRTIWEYYLEGWTAEEIDARLRTFEQKQALKVGIHQQMKMDKGGATQEEIDTIILEMVEKRRSIRTANMGDTSLCTLTELFEETEQEYKWLLPNRIPAGKLLLASGPAKRGKTTSLIQSFIDLIFTGESLGQKGEPFQLLYVDYENDTSYLKTCILNPAMKGRDWKTLEKWLKISNRQVKRDKVKLPPYITGEYVERLLKPFDKPTFVLIDSLRRAFGRTPGLKNNWEWDANIISNMLDPLGEIAHRTGHTIGVIHHHNNQGRASGSTDIIASPDIILDFLVTFRGGVETNDREIKITGRLPMIKPMFLTFENGLYRYLGEGEEGKNQMKDETSYALMESIVKSLGVTPKSGTELKTELNVSNRNKITETAKYLEDRGIVIQAKKKYNLAEGWEKQWNTLRHDFGYRDKPLVRAEEKIITTTLPLVSDDVLKC